MDYEHDVVDVFDAAYPVTADNDILLIPTPGHTYYHSSVLVKYYDVHLLIAGDVSHKHDHLLKGLFGVANIDYIKSKEIYQKNNNLCK